MRDAIAQSKSPLEIKGSTARLKRVAVALVALLASVGVQAAQQWSSCQTVVNVNNYLAYNNSVVVGLSPGIPGCAPSFIAGSVAFTVGVSGVTAANVGSFLSSALLAYASGTRVMVYYDDAAIPNCQGIIVASGGYSGQCP